MTYTDVWQSIHKRSCRALCTTIQRPKRQTCRTPLPHERAPTTADAPITAAATSYMLQYLFGLWPKALAFLCGRPRSITSALKTRPPCVLLHRKDTVVVLSYSGAQCCSCLASARGTGSWDTFPASAPCSMPPCSGRSATRISTLRPELYWRGVFQPLANASQLWLAPVASFDD